MIRESLRNYTTRNVTPQFSLALHKAPQGWGVKQKILSVQDTGAQEWHIVSLLDDVTSPTTAV